MYGNCVDLPTSTPAPTTTTVNQPDFWSEHENQESNHKLRPNTTSKSSNAPIDKTIGPNVSLANVGQGAAKDYKPSLIGSKRAPPKKGVMVSYHSSKLSDLYVQKIISYTLCRRFNQKFSSTRRLIDEVETLKHLS